jgi:enediyne biosynthesis protein E4
VSHKTWENGAFFTPEFIQDNSWNGYEHDVLYRNDDNGRMFTDVAHVAGIDLDSDGRGLTYLDYDQDGDLDVVVVGHRQAATLLRNDIGDKNNWLQIDLRGTHSNRFGVGARLTVRTGGRRQIREVRDGGGFLTAYIGPVTFGLGDATKVDELVIRWPGGRVQTLNNIPARQKIRVVEPN